MSLGEIIWLLIIASATIPLANDIYEMFGMLMGGIFLGIISIYIGRKWKRKK